MKTRLQGQPHTRVQKYTNMMQAYTTIFKQEGVMRGLYAGVTPAMIGSSKITHYCDKQDIITYIDSSWNNTLFCYL